MRSMFFVFCFFNIYLAVLGLNHGMWDVVPRPEMEPGHWERAVLATGLPGKSQEKHLDGGWCTGRENGYGKRGWQQ